MLKQSANKILLAASALLLCAAFAQAQPESASPLIPNPTSVAITYQLGSGGGAGTDVPVTVTAAAGTDAFVVNSSTVPFWLTLGGTGLTGLGGTATTSGVQVTFVASTQAGTLDAGTYTANVHFAVSGYQDLVVPVSLSVEPSASTLSTSATLASSTLPLANGNTYTGTQIPVLNWTYGSSPYPTIPLTIYSSDAPVAFSASITSPSPASPSWVILSASTGIAYNFGTGLTVSFLPDVLKNAPVNATLSFTLNISYGSTPTILTYTFTIQVTQPYATLSTAAPLFPAYTPPVGSGTLKAVVTGSGFYATASGISPTLVSITYGPSTGLVGPVLLTSLVALGGAVSVVNPNTMILTIPYEDATPVSILDTAGQNVTITISSALSGQPTLTATLTVTSNPIIDSVVDAGALEEPAGGATPTFAPYELITIFGNNFCATAPCANVVAPVGTDSRYPNTLTVGTGALSVAFNNQSGTLIGNAYLIFANDTQINALVPSGILATGITGLEIVVTSGINVSNTYTATPKATNPGIFTTDASGQGQGAILNPDYSVNSSTNPVTTGDTVSIYATGLGTPNSTAASSSSTKTPVFPTSCFETSLYVTGEGLANPATADGAVLVSSVWGVGNLPPCFATKNWVTATIGGLAATVTYAGWVSGSVTGLYQINVTVPAKATTSTTAVSLPLVLTVDGVETQAGVTVSVKE
jgi:uncharacterized protein (TIGR03437 family)